MSATGTLLYTALCTRPDIFFSVAQLCRFNSNPGEKHVEASKQVFQYLAPGRTGDQGIRFTRSPKFDGKIRIIGYVDSDWGGCVDTRRSTAGFVIHVANGPVSWLSKLMKTMALSSCEADRVHGNVTDMQRNRVDVSVPRRDRSPVPHSRDPLRLRVSTDITRKK